MIEPLDGSLIIIELPKIYRFFLWKFFHFKKVSLKDSLRMLRGTLTTILDAL